MIVAAIWNGPANAAERSLLARREVPLLRELSAGVEVIVVLLGDEGGFANDLRQAEIRCEVLPVPMPPSARALLNLPAAVSLLRKLLREIGPDIIEATEPMPAIAAGLAARSRRVLYRRQHPRGSGKLTMASWVAARLTTRTVVANEAMRQVSSSTDRTPLDRIFVANPGSAEPRTVSPDEVREAREKVGIPPGAAVVLMVSRLRREKGIDVLLEAAGHVRLDRDVHYVVVGSGPEDVTLRRLAAARGSRTHFLGHCDDVALCYAMADVVAIPSRRESFGRTTLEALAMGRPVVASNVGGLPEALGNESGILVPPEDPRALAAALETLLRDPELLRRTGRAARARYESRFTIARMAEGRWRVWKTACEALVA